MMRTMTTAASAFVLSGCAAQIGSGTAMTSADAPDRVTITTSVSSAVSRRERSAVFGARSTQTIDYGIKLKQVALHAGYEWYLHQGCFVVAPIGIDLGAGGPVSHRYDGIGSYVGWAGDARLRLKGDDDLKRSYSIVFVAVELVVAPRYGVWFPPEASARQHVVPELAGEIALRVVFGSDITNASQGRPAGEERPNEPTSGEGGR